MSNFTISIAAILLITSQMAVAQLRDLNVLEIDTMSEAAIKKALKTQKGPIYIGLSKAGMTSVMEDPIGSRDYLQNPKTYLEKLMAKMELPPKITVEGEVFKANKPKKSPIYFGLEKAGAVLSKEIGNDTMRDVYFVLKSAGLAKPQIEALSQIGKPLGSIHNSPLTKELLNKTYRGIMIQENRALGNNLTEHSYTEYKYKPKYGKKQRIRHYIEGDEGKKVKIEVEYRNDRALEQSPEKLKRMLKEVEYRMYGPDGKPEYSAFNHHTKAFGIEAVSFYYGVGLHSVYNLISESEENPLALQQFRQMLQDPISHLSFAAFVAANRATNAHLTSILTRAAYGKMSNSAMASLSRFVLPQMGMAMGGIASNLVHDISSLTKACADSLFQSNKKQGKVSEEAIQNCDQTYSYIFSSDKGYEYVTAISSLLASNIALMGVTMTGVSLAKYLGQTAMMQGMMLPLRYAAGLVPVPLIKVATMAPWLKKLVPGMAQLNLILFFEVDEELAHPYFHHAIQKNFDSGLSTSMHYKELVERLQKADIKREANVDTIEFKPSRKKVGWFKSNWDPLSGFLRTDSFGTPSVEVKDFNTLLNGYQKHSKKWRETLFTDFYNKYTSWTGKIAPFNSAVQMTYEFHQQFFEKLNTSKNNNAANRLFQKDDLLDQNVLSNIRMTDTYGQNIEQTQGSVLNIASIEQNQLNTLSASTCLVHHLEQEMKSVYGTYQINNIAYFHVLKAQKYLAKLAPVSVCKPLNLTDKIKVKSSAMATNKPEVAQQLAITPELNPYTLFKETPKLATLNDDTLLYARNALSHLHYAFMLSEEHQAKIELNTTTWNFMLSLKNALTSGPYFMPADRGELFLYGENAYFTAQNPVYSTVFSKAPSHYILKAMACSDKDLIIERTGLSTFYKSPLEFNPPRLTPEIPTELCKKAYVPKSIDGVDYAREKIQHNMNLSELTNYIADNLPPQFINDQSGFANNWWVENIETTVDEKYVDLNQEYSRNILEYLLPVMFNSDDNTYAKHKSEIESSLTRHYLQQSDILTGRYLRKNFDKKVENLSDSYVLSIDLYLNYLEQTYLGLSLDNSAASLWKELKVEYLQTFNEMLGVYGKRAAILNQYSDAEDILKAEKSNNLLLATKYGKLLALYKKIKSSFINKDQDIYDAATLIENANSIDQVGQESLATFRESIWPTNPDLLTYEYLNLLEQRILPRANSKTDNYINEQFRIYLLRGPQRENGEYIERSVSERYMGIAPLVLSEKQNGQGITAVYQVLNHLMDTMEEAYSISKMVSLASTNIYKSAEVEKDIQRAKAGSLRAK